MISAYWWFPWTSLVPSTLKDVGHDAAKTLALPLTGVLCVLSALRVPLRDLFWHVLPRPELCARLGESVGTVGTFTPAYLAWGGKAGQEACSSGSGV